VRNFGHFAPPLVIVEPKKCLSWFSLPPVPHTLPAAFCSRMHKRFFKETHFWSSALASGSHTCPLTRRASCRGPPRGQSWPGSTHMPHRSAGPVGDRNTANCVVYRPVGLRISMFSVIGERIRNKQCPYLISIVLGLLVLSRRIRHYGKRQYGVHYFNFQMRNVRMLTASSHRTTSKHDITRNLARGYP
jgi:hypothetical protein